MAGELDVALFGHDIEMFRVTSLMFLKMLVCIKKVSINRLKNFEWTGSLFQFHEDLKDN